MPSYTHFTLEERICLQELLSKEFSMRKIAGILGRSPSSVSREIKRNASRYRPHKGSNNQYRYHAWRANNLYIRRRREHVYRAIQPGSAQWNYIIDKLNEFWSPETICGRWNKEHPGEKALHHSTIYRYIGKKEFPNITRKKNLRRKGKHYVHRDSNYNTIHPDRIIPQWPEEIKGRTRIGDWEGDTIYGGVGKGLLVTLVDRKSRFVRIGRVQSRDAGEVRAMIAKLLDGLPVHSISLDNGSEFSQFRELEKELGTTVYFAEPHKPWQRGTNENTNDLIRFFFPKGHDFHQTSDLEITLVEAMLNLRPRKCLNWMSPLEFFLSHSVALA